jgi:hypothetical protein
LLTEPLAVGWHAVRRAEVKKSDVAIVIGCGPVGLAVICVLKARGVGTVVASDFSTGRRQLAAACGADIVVDPGAQSPYEAPGDRSFLTSLPAAVGLAIGTMEKLRPMPVPWKHVWRVGEALGGKPKHPVIFECVGVGVPGILDGIMAKASRPAGRPSGPSRCWTAVMASTMSRQSAQQRGTTPPIRSRRGGIEAEGKVLCDPLRLDRFGDSDQDPHKSPQPDQPVQPPEPSLPLYLC